MPLSDNEQQILRQIEENLSATSWCCAARSRS